ncbi:MAG: hypothetical protein QJR06_10065 [Alicyclobacillaceae bacterium]|nr:hypothetical protein [Alicyclobacillaceae bacterium]
MVHQQHKKTRRRHRVRAYQKVEFSNLDHLIENLAGVGTRIVRLDLFEEVRQSELSFVYYITPTVFVTALDPSGYTVYEYREPFETVASDKKRLSNPTLLEPARRRMGEIEQHLRTSGFDVRYGRCTVPFEFQADSSHF